MRVSLPELRERWRELRERILEIDPRLYLAGVGALIAIFMFTSMSASGRARRIAARNAEARGGLAAWRAVKTMSMWGKLDAGVRRDPVKLAMAYQKQAQSPQSKRSLALIGAAAEKPVQLPFVMELARPRKTRLEIQFQGQTAVQVYDGKQGWKLRPFLGRREVEPFTAEELRLSAQQADLDGPLIDYAAKGNALELVGAEKLEGHDAYKIRVTMKDGQVRHVWVDTRTFLELKVDGTRRLDGKERPVSTWYRDYKRFGGLLIPTVMETSVDGVSGSEKIIVERVAVNPPLADGLFGRPDPTSGSSVGPAQPALAPKKDDAGDPHAQHHEAAELKRASRTTADYQLPHVTLIRDDGKSVSLPAELDDGRPIVLDFIFTNCSSICPVMSQVFAQLQDKLGADRDKVHLVSISIDPEQDRPARLADYARKFHAGPEWRQYTGSVEASVAVQRAFDAYRGDKMNHTPVTFLRAAPGRRWERIDGFASADELAREVRAMLANR